MVLVPISGSTVEFTQGDNVTLTLVAQDDSGNPQTLTGTIVSQVAGPNGSGDYTIPASQHTILDQTTNQGQFTITFLATDTQSCGEGVAKDIISENVSSSSSVTYFRGYGILTVYANTPRQ